MNDMSDAPKLWASKGETVTCIMGHAICDMARDIYQNGLVLARKKYRLLGWAYRIFLAGLTASLAAFVVQSFA